MSSCHLPQDTCGPWALFLIDEEAVSADRLLGACPPPCLPFGGSVATLPGHCLPGWRPEDWRACLGWPWILEGVGLELWQSG